MKKLVIWDFDGVVADTEFVWVDLWLSFAKERLGLDWDFETAYKNFAGISVKSKVEKLKNLGIIMSDEMIEEIVTLQMTCMPRIKITNGFVGVLEMLKEKGVAFCIATGGTSRTTKEKIATIEVGKYFDEQNVFTADMVKYGKPEPDVFLLAADCMGFEPKDCIVVEDSIAGIMAAKAAKMDVIAFVEHEKLDKVGYVKKVKELGVMAVANDMSEVSGFLV